MFFLFNDHGARHILGLGAFTPNRWEWNLEEIYKTYGTDLSFSALLHWPSSMIPYRLRSPLDKRSNEGENDVEKLICNYPWLLHLIRNLAVTRRLLKELKIIRDSSSLLTKKGWGSTFPDFYIYIYIIGNYSHPPHSISYHRKL